MGAGSSMEDNETKFLSVHNTPFAMHFGEEQLREFSESFDITYLKHSDVIYKAGKSANKMYIVGNGVVQITQDSPDSAGAFTYLKRPGDFFGESAVTRAKTETAFRIGTAIAYEEDTCLLGIDRSTLYKVFKAHPEWKRRILSIIGRKMETYLSEIPFLAKADPKELTLLGSVLHYVVLKKRRTLFEEGSIGRSLYIICKGAVDAVTERDGETIILTHIPKGSFFGEIGLMIDMPRTASIVATEDCLLLELAKKDVTSFMEIAPSTSEHFDKITKERISTSFQKYNIPFFEPIPMDKYSVLAELCSIEERNSDEVVWKSGEPSSTFYIIAHGEINTTPGNEFLGAGHFFGEECLINDQISDSTYTCGSHCVILSLTRKNFELFIDAVPELAEELRLRLIPN